MNQMEQTIKSPKVVNLVKASIIAGVSSISVVLTQNQGLLQTMKGVEYLAINVILTTLMYLIFNAISPSKSIKGHIDWLDLVKGTLLAVCSAWLNNKVGNYTGTPTDLLMLWQQGLGVGIGYITKTLASQEGVPTFMLGLLPKTLKTDVAAADVAVKEEKLPPPTEEGYKAAIYMSQKKS